MLLTTQREENSSFPTADRPPMCSEEKGTGKATVLLSENVGESLGLKTLGSSPGFI